MPAALAEAARADVSRFWMYLSFESLCILDVNLYVH